MAKSRGDLQWFYDFWADIAQTQTRDYYKKMIKGNRTHPVGTITFNASDASEEDTFLYDPEKLDALRRWVASNPGLNQSQIKAQQTVFRTRRVVVKDLKRLESLGLASWEKVATGGKGRPAYMWTAESRWLRRRPWLRLWRKPGTCKSGCYR